MIGTSKPNCDGLRHASVGSRLWPEVSSLEANQGNDFCQSYVDWARDAALWLGRKHGRLTLRELGQLCGGMNYGTVAQAVSRFAKRLEQQGELRQTVATIESQLSNV